MTSLFNALEHTGFRKYLKNTLWMFAGQSTMVISLFINIWIARNLGPANYGNLSFIFAYVSLFSFIANLGVNDILIRELVKRPEDTPKLLGTAFKLLSFGGITAFIISSISIFFIEKNPLIQVLVVLYSTIFLWSPVNVIAAYFQARVEAQRNAYAQIIGTLITSALKIFFLITNQGIIWLTIAFALDYVIGTALYVYNYSRTTLKIKNWVSEKKLFNLFFYSSGLLMLANAMNYLLFKIDQVMIKHYLGESSLGLYSVAVKLSEVWYFIPAILCTSLFPAIINSKTTDEQLYRKRVLRLYGLLIIIAVSIAIPISLFSMQIVTLLYGLEYAASSNILSLYIWSSIGLFLMTGINRKLIADNRLMSLFIYSVIAVGTNIALNMVWIPKFGASGAAWATLVSYSISPIIVYIVSLITYYGNKKIR